MQLFKIFVYQSENNAHFFIYTTFIGGSKKGARNAHPLLGPIYFIFMQFMENTLPDNSLAHTPFWEILDLPLTMDK